MPVMQVVSFGADHIENSLAEMTAAEIDELPFGVVQLNGAGRVLMYNATEMEITGCIAGDVIGKNFFTTVAPCTDVPAFRGRFEAGVKSGKMNVLFEWAFGDRGGMVQVHMKQAREADRYWVFAKRL